MRHGDHYIRLGLNTRGRRLLFHSQMSSLLEHHRIVTTEAKAKALRRVMERFITRAKRGSWRSHQKLQSFFGDQPATLSLLKLVAERFKERTGGYTRLWKLGYRKGDRAPLSMIELVDAPFDMKQALAMFQNKAENERLIKGLHVSPDTASSSSTTLTSGSTKRQHKDQAFLDSVMEPNTRHDFASLSLNPHRFDWLKNNLKVLLDQDITQRRARGSSTLSPSSSGYLNSLLFKSDIK